VCLFFGENSGEFLESCNTSASQKFNHLVVAVTWLYNVDKVVSLRPRYNTDCRTSKLTDKSIVRVDEVQQLYNIHAQHPHPSFV